MSVFFWESILDTFFLKSKCGELIDVGLFSYTKHITVLFHIFIVTVTEWSFIH